MPAIVTASEVNRVIGTTQLNQVMDEVNTPGHKWFSLHDNVLDGSYHLFDSASALQVGWWGSTLSDVGGVFASPPVLTITETRSIQSLQVVGDSLLNDYPVDFTVKLYNGTTLLHTETVTGNEAVVWKKNLSATFDVTKIEITVSKVNKASRVAKIVDAFSPFEIIRTDTLKPNLTEVSLVPLGINSTDAIKIAGSLNENDTLTIQLTRTDNLKVKLQENIEMTNVHTRMNETFRQTYAKVEITYTDPFLDNTINITDNGAAYNTSSEELIDNIEVPAHKWLSLSDNKLDGTYSAIGGTKEYSVGWWSAALSDGSGNFAVKPMVTVTFAPRALYTLKVVGDAALNNYPVDFEIKCYDHTNTVVHTETVIGNSDIKWFKNINTLLGITKLELTISKINKSNDTAKLTEFFTAIVETYYNDGIVDLSLLEELAYPSDSIALGSVSANEIDISLDNSDGKFNLGNTQSPLYNLIKRNRRVRAWLGVEIIPETIEWYPLGVFWTVGWDVPDNSLEAHTTARDRLELLRLSNFTTSLVYENYSLYQLFQIVLDDAGLLPSDYVLDASLNSIVIPYAWFDRMSHREALQRLAQCAYIQVYCDRYGKVVVGPIDTSPQVYFNFDNDTNIYSKSYPITASEITNYVEVTIGNVVVKPMQEMLNVSENLTLAAGQSTTLVYSFNSVPAKNIQEPVLTGATDLTIDMIPYAWGIELTLTNNNASSRTVTGIVVQGEPLEIANQSYVVAKDDVLIRDNGKQSVTISHDFIQDSYYAQTLASTLLDAYKQSMYDVSIQARGNMGLFLGHKIQVNDSKMNTNYQYITQRQTINWNGSLSATVDGKKI